MKYIIMLVMGLFFIGCGSSDVVVEEPLITPLQTEGSNIINMEPDTLYTVKRGDKIVKTTENAVVKIRRETESDSSEVTLLQGEAQIISVL